jgi:hypothetical protein
MFLQVLHERAAGAVHDALGHARRAGRIEDVQRMVERQALERDRDLRLGAQPVRPEDGVRQPRNVRPLLNHRHDDDVADGWQRGRDGLETRADVVCLAAVPVAIDGNEDRRLDLAETIEHALHAEVRRA